MENSGALSGLDEASYVSDGQRFIATPHTRGPWSPDLQHAGPPSALLARAIERAVADDPALAVTRLTVELLAPIPIAAFEIQTSVLRAGRKVRRIDATLTSENRAIARATGLAIRTAGTDIPPSPAPRACPDPPDRGGPHLFPVVLGSPEGYATAVEARGVAGATQEGGIAAWIRTRVALVAGERPSPLQRVMIAADSGNGVAVPLDPRRFTFVNADLTVACYRPLDGEWVCLDAVTARDPAGIGLTETRLWDVRGPSGRGLQPLVIEPREA